MKVNGVAIIAIIAFLSSEVWAQDRVDYPELLVTPRASDRLKIESESEMRRPWNFQWAITVSAMTTLVAGLMQDEDPSKDPQGNSGTVGMLVGGGWLAVNMFMVYGVRGYKSAYDKVAPMPAHSTREALTRERLAEEEINRLGRLSRTMKWLSFATNGFASIQLLSNAKTDTTSKVVDMLALGASFFPLLFTNHWEDVAQEQQQYKKKIFGPVASTMLLPVMVGERTKFVPGLGLTASF
ncbi:MAG: hypothetical protein A2X86_03180 [Bdellovibrionales bacterium GWA2_49_15]|nr:MAG: hypothetical protein A2X86_03180 [Bdellovibrionales bacterium GWA2_49_15]HAZ12217.1 hypothetical protein [Bdellovibrionales bacterium]